MTSARAVLTIIGAAFCERTRVLSHFASWSTKKSA